MYMPCPNKDVCDGEVPFVIEETDDAAADIYGSRSYHVAFIDDDENKTTHAPNCPPLTPTQREELENEATRQIGEDPHFFCDEP